MRSRSRGLSPVLLTLNAGSSSIKVGLFRLTDGHAENVGRALLDLQGSPLSLSLTTPAQRLEVQIRAAITDDLRDVLDALLQVLAEHFDLAGLCAVGHRVVHGGLHLTHATVIDDASLADLDGLVELAPLHQPHSLRLIRALRHLRPALLQTASFDTAFHATQADLVRRFGLPRRLHDEGVRRYGFHGLSYAYISRRLAVLDPVSGRGRVVAAHLGSGASLCAMHNGRSVDASMGFSTLDGVPMGTRCGALDAGVVLYLLQERAMTTDQLEAMLYHQSGLLGVSGLSADVRVLEASASLPAGEALALFSLRAAGEVARLASTLGGLDALVFTAGIGEHDAGLRASICDRLGWLGLRLDPAANHRHDLRISDPASAIAVWVIPTDEEQVIADEAMALLATLGQRPGG